MPPDLFGEGEKRPVKKSKKSKKDKESLEKKRSLSNAGLDVSDRSAPPAKRLSGPVHLPTLICDEKLTACV